MFNGVWEGVQSKDRMYDALSYVQVVNVNVLYLDVLL